MNRKLLGVSLFLAVLLPCQLWAQAPLVFESDLGLKDGAVAAMKGLALTVSPDLKMYDLTHEIPTFNTWEGAYWLKETAPYWPPGTVFVAVIDPGAGAERKSLVLKTKSGHYFVSPNNGTLTLVVEDLGIAEIRKIDEAKFPRPGAEKSTLFAGRDVFASVGASLASGKMPFEEVGPKLDAEEMVLIPYQKPAFDGKAVSGTIPMPDLQDGNVWTNIDAPTFEKLGVKKGELVTVQIKTGEEVMFEENMVFVATAGDVPEGDLLAYFNDQADLSFAINQDNFADTYGIASGPDWHVRVQKAAPKK